MGTAKINFEMDSDVLANAQAFAAKNRVSLNKLVATYFASLGRTQDAPAPTGGPLPILLQVSMGKLSLPDAARELNLGDGGHVLALMRQNGIPLAPTPLPSHHVKAQVEATRDALLACLLPAKAEGAEKSSKAKTRGKAGRAA